MRPPGRCRPGAACVGAVGVAAAVAGCVQPAWVREPLPEQPLAALTPRLTGQASGTRALLQAVSPVNERVVWVSGHLGTWVRTTDGGATWRAGRVPGADSLQFRDVHAVSARIAYLLAAGPGERSRIYKTTDGGRTWRLQFQNPDSVAFFDCFAFWDAEHGLAVSDAVNGRLIILTTDDGGAHWRRVPDEAIPPALSGEGAFAASGTCVVTQGRSQAWIGTGAADGARVYHTADRGRTWSVAPTPIVHGPASGIASLAFRDTLAGMALGGRIADLEFHSRNIATTRDGGRTWTLLGRPQFSGPVFGAAWVPGLAAPTLVAVGPRGVAVTFDDGANWGLLSDGSYWAVAFASPYAGWAVGPEGRITRIALR